MPPALEGQRLNSVEIPEKPEIKRHASSMGNASAWGNACVHGGMQVVHTC